MTLRKRLLLRLLPRFTPAALPRAVATLRGSVRAAESDSVSPAASAAQRRKSGAGMEGPLRGTVLSRGSAVLASAALSAVAAFAARPAHAQPATPTTLPAACPDDIWHCLPAWRWTTWGNSLVTANPEPGTLAGIAGAGNAIFNIIAQLPLMLAEFIWRVTLTMLKLAVDPELISRIYSDIFMEKLAENWKSVLKFAGLPAADGGSILLPVMMMIAVIIAAWIVIKPRPRNWAKPNTTQYGIWYKALAKVMATVIPIAMLMVISTSVDDPDAPWSPTGIKQNITDRIHDYVTPILSTASGYISPNPGSTGPSACGLYKAKLKEYFNSGGGDFKKARAELPKSVSDMWESSYLQLLGMAQFGDSETAKRAMCFTMEWKKNRITPGTQLKTMYEALGVGVDVNSLLPADPKDPLKPDTSKREQVIERVGRDVFRPRGSYPHQVGSLLTLASACGFAKQGTASSEYGSYIFEAPHSEAHYGPQEGVAFDAIHTTPTGTPKKQAPPAPVWLHKEWTGLQNEAGKVEGDHRNMLSSNVCAAWMFPGIVDWPTHMYGAAVYPGLTGGGYMDYSAALKRKVAGVRSAWVQNHAAIDAADEKRRTERVKAYRADGVAGVPPITDTVLVNRVMDAARGGNHVNRLVYSILAAVVAWIYLKAMRGVVVGFLIAQLILATLFFLLPLLLLLIALPIEAVVNFRKRLIRLYIATALSYALFYTLMTVLVLMTDVIRQWLEALTKADGMIRAVLVAAAPLLALWMLGKGLKMCGIGGALSLKGAAQLSSGMSAAGMKLPNPREFASKARSTSSKWLTRGAKATRTGRSAAALSGSGVKSGIRGAKAARQARTAGKSQLKAAAGSIGADFKTAWTKAGQRTARHAKDFSRWVGDDLEQRSKFKTTAWTKAGNERRDIDGEAEKLEEERNRLFPEQGNPSRQQGHQEKVLDNALRQARQNSGNGSGGGVDADHLAGILSRGLDIAQQRQDFRLRKRAHEARKKGIGQTGSRKRKAAAVNPAKAKVSSGGGATDTPDETWDEPSEWADDGD